MVKSWNPNNLKEAWDIRKSNIVVPYAGGTDYMIRKNSKDELLFLNEIIEIKEVTEDENNIYIGAVCNYTQLLHNSIVPKILKNAISGIAAPAIRNRGTIGGNICNASPAGDTLPVLYALNARLKISSAENSRIVNIDDFIIGPKKSLLMYNELLESIIIPKGGFNILYYKKIGARNAQSISKISFVGLMNVEDNIIKDMRIALGAVGPRVVRSKDIEASCIDKTRDEIIREKQNILDEYEKLITPIDDQRSTAKYRKRVSLNLIEDFIVNS